MVEGYRHIYYNITLEARAATQHANTQGLCACLGGRVHGARPLLFPPHPSCKGPRLCNPAYPPLHSYRSRHGRSSRPPEEPLPPPHAHGPPPVAPTEVRCEFLKSSFFVVAVFLWSNRVIIRINMHREATRNPHMVPWGWGEGRKKYFLFFYFPNILRKKNISI